MGQIKICTKLWTDWVVCGRIYWENFLSRFSSLCSLLFVMSALACCHSIFHFLPHYTILLTARGEIIFQAFCKNLHSLCKVIVMGIEEMHSAVVGFCHFLLCSLYKVDCRSRVVFLDCIEAKLPRTFSVLSTFWSVFSRSMLSHKRIPIIITCNLKTYYQILIIFGANIADTIGHQMTVQVPTSPCVCFYTTWGK